VRNSLLSAGACGAADVSASGDGGRRRRGEPDHGGDGGPRELGERAPAAPTLKARRSCRPLRARGRGGRLHGSGRAGRRVAAAGSRVPIMRVRDAATSGRESAEDGRTGAAGGQARRVDRRGGRTGAELNPRGCFSARRTRGAGGRGGLAR
jgi:hypothetical protein